MSPYIAFELFIYRYCGVKDPSWAEIRHFVMFLDLQLQSCEKLLVTNQTFKGDMMAGFKGFVVKYMIQMSRVSLEGELCMLLWLRFFHHPEIFYIFSERRVGEREQG